MTHKANERSSSACYLMFDKFEIYFLHLILILS